MLCCRAAPDCRRLLRQLLHDHPHKCGLCCSSALQAVQVLTVAGRGSAGGPVVWAAAGDHPDESQDGCVACITGCKLWRSWPLTTPPLTPRLQTAGQTIAAVIMLTFVLTGCGPRLPALHGAPRGHHADERDCAGDSLSEASPCGSAGSRCGQLASCCRLHIPPLLLLLLELTRFCRAVHLLCLLVRGGPPCSLPAPPRSSRHMLTPRTALQGVWAPGPHRVQRPPDLRLQLRLRRKRCGPRAWSQPCQLRSQHLDRHRPAVCAFSALPAAVPASGLTRVQQPATCLVSMLLTPNTPLRLHSLGRVHLAGPARPAEQPAVPAGQRPADRAGAAAEPQQPELPDPGPLHPDPGARPPAHHLLLRPALEDAPQHQGRLGWPLSGGHMLPWAFSCGWR